MRASPFEDAGRVQGFYADLRANGLCITQQFPSRAKRNGPVRKPPPNEPTTIAVNNIPLIRIAARIALLSATLAATPLVAQSMTMQAVAKGDLIATADDGNGVQGRAVVADGTDVSNGVTLQAMQVLPTPQAHTTVQVTTQPHAASASIRSAAWTSASATKMPFAKTGISEVLIQVTLAQPMLLDFSYYTSVIACTGAPTGKAWIDIGNDGTIDLQATPGATLFGFANHDVTLAMPAGTTEILLGTELDLPAVETIGRVVETTATLSIQPAYALINWEGTGCGAQLDAAPMLNGDVRFWVSGQQLGDLPFLVFGNHRQTQPFPITPGCNLLVTPDVIVPMAAWSYEHVPMAGLNGQLFAQGAILRPQSLFLSPAGLFTTQRIAIGLQ